MPVVASLQTEPPMLDVKSSKFSSQFVHQYTTCQLQNLCHCAYWPCTLAINNSLSSKAMLLTLPSYLLQAMHEEGTLDSFIRFS